MPSFYPRVSSGAYVNVLYAMCIKLDEYISKKILNNDSSRIIYSSTDYALIKRSGTNEWNNANLPFVNYKMDGKEAGGVRNWFSMEAFSQGIFIPELRKKLRIAPTTISFDCSYWTSRDDDFQYVTDTMILDAMAESKFSFPLDFAGTIVDNIAILDFEFDTSPKFTETDWLEKNNIHCLGMNIKAQTFLPLDTAEGFCIPKTLLMDFLVKKDIINQGEVVEYDEALEFTIDHFNQTIIEK
jgi:hypothetical protein